MPAANMPLQLTVRLRSQLNRATLGRRTENPLLTDEQLVYTVNQGREPAAGTGQEYRAEHPEIRLECSAFCARGSSTLVQEIVLLEDQILVSLRNKPHVIPNQKPPRRSQRLPWIA